MKYNYIIWNMISASLKIRWIQEQSQEHGNNE